MDFPNIKHYFSIESCGGASISPTNETFCFIYNQPGQFQLFEADLHPQRKMWPKQITFSEDRCTNPRYLSDGTILYLQDHNGNENFQMWILDNAKQSHLLSADQDAKHIINFISKDYVYFSANIESKSIFSIYRQKIPLLEHPFELIYQPESQMGLYEVDLDDSPGISIIITQYVSIVEQNLLLYNMKEKTLKNLSAIASHESKASWHAIRWIDENHLLISTDYLSDYDILKILTIDGELIDLPVLSQLPPYEVQKFAWCYDHPYTYFVLNQEGYSKLYRARFTPLGVKDLKNVPLPMEGVIISGDLRTSTNHFNLSPNGKYLSITFSTSNFPMNIWMLDTDTLQWWCSTDVNLHGINPKSFIKSELLHFQSSDGYSIPYYRYLPTSTPPQNGFPAILSIHGGPEGQSKPIFSSLNQYFLRSNIALIVPNIRGSTGYGKKYTNLDNIEKRLDSIRDIAELAKHLTNHDNLIDGSRLGIFGGSYGGFAVLSAITEYPELWKAAAELFGISNFETFLENTAPWRRRLREVEYGFLDRDRAILKRISPIHQIHKIKCPLFIEGGDTDERVPISETIQIHNAIKDRVSTELVRLPDEGHGVTRLKNKIFLYPKIIQWFIEYL